MKIISDKIYSVKNQNQFNYKSWSVKIKKTIWQW